MSEIDNTTPNTGDAVDEQTAPENRPQSKNDIPSELPILPLRNTVAFPFSMMPLSVGIPRSVNLVNDALK
ncbi:MAG: LON peptidase substrate-binding domain-containing protein, partial [Desulfobacterales bacterium]